MRIFFSRCDRINNLLKLCKHSLSSAQWSWWKSHSSYCVHLLSQQANIKQAETWWMVADRREQRRAVGWSVNARPPVPDGHVLSAWRTCGWNPQAWPCSACQGHSYQCFIEWICALPVFTKHWWWTTSLQMFPKQQFSLTFSRQLRLNKWWGESAERKRGWRPEPSRSSPQVSCITQHI